jgi:hypothetical protein
MQAFATHPISDEESVRLAVSGPLAGAYPKWHKLHGFDREELSAILQKYNPDPNFVHTASLIIESLAYDCRHRDPDATTAGESVEMKIQRALRIFTLTSRVPLAGKLGIVAIVKMSIEDQQNLAELLRRIPIERTDAEQQLFEEAVEDLAAESPRESGDLDSAKHPFDKASQ